MIYEVTVEGQTAGADTHQTFQTSSKERADLKFIESIVKCMAADQSYMVTMLLHLHPDDDGIVIYYAEV